MLRCADDSYYVGMTSESETRVWKHQTGYYKDCYTYTRRPVELVYYAHFDYVEDAIAHEKKLKGWSRKKKEALFMGDRDRLVELSKRKHNVSKVEDVKRKSRKVLQRHNILRDAKKPCHPEEPSGVYGGGHPEGRLFCSSG